MIKDTSRHSGLVLPHQADRGGAGTEGTSDFHPKTTRAHEVWRFLQIRQEQSFRVSAGFEMSDIPQIHAAFDRVFPGFEVRRTMDWNYRRKPGEWGPESQLFQMAGGEYQSLVVSGVLFCEYADQQRVVLIVREQRYPGCTENVVVEMIGPASQTAKLNQQLEELVRLVRTLPHFLQGQVINAQGEPLHKPGGQVSLDDVALPEATRKLVLQNTVELLRNREQYARWRMPLTRGIVLHGRPGNGKTLIGRALASMSLATFIHVNPEDLADNGVRSLFRLARRLSPAIVFLEDLDFVAGKMHRESGSPRFAELLVQLDGLERNDGLIVIATTNELESLDPAIKGRPNRFDVVIPVTEPDIDSRRQIITKQIGDLATAEVIDAAAMLTDGLSGAQVKETSIRACLAAIRSGHHPGELAANHFESSLEGLPKIADRKPAGFK